MPRALPPLMGLLLVTGCAGDKADTGQPGFTDTLPGGDTVYGGVETDRPQPDRYIDEDGDGYGDSDRLISDYTSEEGLSELGGDCNDTDPTVNPGAEEICDDWVDNDCAGGRDCMDAACAGAASCYESDCADGDDNDGDGLTDCEDGECSAELFCYESDCSDGDDEDSDGQIDCEDDDCWGTVICEPSLIVLGGEMWLSVTMAGSTAWNLDYDASAQLYSVTGVLQIPTSSGYYTCGWSLDSARVTASYEGGSPVYSADRAVRAGFETDCSSLRLSDLPDDFQVAWGSVPLAGGGAWYHGSPASSSVYGDGGRWHFTALAPSDPFVLE